jgi:hypothetical protein
MKNIRFLSCILAAFSFSNFIYAMNDEESNRYLIQMQDEVYMDYTDCTIDINKLAEAIGKNRTVKRLKLVGNKIGDENVEVIGKALQTNKTIRNISLCKNNFTSDGSAKLVEYLTSNYSLIIITLCCKNIVSVSTQENIDRLTKLNATGRGEASKLIFLSDFLPKELINLIRFLFIKVYQDQIVIEKEKLLK